MACLLYTSAQVANITEKDLNDVLEVRITLENMAIEKACANMTDADIRKLEQAAEVFQTSTAEGDLVKMAEADVNFHEVIYEAADNKRLMQVLNNLREQIYRYRVEYLKEDCLLYTSSAPAPVLHSALIPGGQAVPFPRCV